MDLTNIGSSVRFNPFMDTPAPQKDAASSSPSPGDILDSFGQVFQDSLNKVNDLQVNAQNAVKTYAVGGPIELHQVMIASEKADLSLEMTMQIRNKMLQAYQEISRMNV